MAVWTHMRRLEDTKRLYTLLDRLETASGGKGHLNELGTASRWPRRGVYFFFEPSENRSGSGDGPRLVRIGTHALGTGARSTLHQRLRQHAGRSGGAGGNHRGSIFRLLVGEALIARGDCPACTSWGVKGDISKAAAALAVDRQDLASSEGPVEAAVSAWLARLPFLWLPIDDEPGPDSLRGYIERNTIALASCHSGEPIDPPSSAWLGHFSGRTRVRQSGLWNQRHVEDAYEPAFLDVLQSLIERA